MRCELLAWGFLVPANRGSGTGGGFICAACTLVKFYERSTVIRKQSSWIQLNYSTHAEGNFITSRKASVYDLADQIFQLLPLSCCITSWVQLALPHRTEHQLLFRGEILLCNHCKGESGVLARENCLTVLAREHSMPIFP